MYSWYYSDTTLHDNVQLILQWYYSTWECAVESTVKLHVSTRKCGYLFLRNTLFSWWTILVSQSSQSCPCVPVDLVPIPKWVVVPKKISVSVMQVGGNTRTWSSSINSSYIPWQRIPSIKWSKRFPLQVNLGFLCRRNKHIWVCCISNIYWTKI